MILGKFEKKVIKKLNSKKEVSQKENFLSIIDYIFNIYFQGLYIHKDGFYVDESKLKHDFLFGLIKIKNMGKFKRLLILKLRRVQALFKYLEEEENIFLMGNDISITDVSSRCLILEIDNKKKLKTNLELHEYFFNNLTKDYYDDYLAVIEEEKYIITEADRCRSEKKNQFFLTLLGIGFTALATFWISSNVSTTITYKDSSSFPYINLENSSVKYVSEDGLRIRQMPSINSDIIGFLTYGEIVRVENNEGEWSKILYYKNEKIFNGWVYKTYLKEIKN